MEPNFRIVILSVSPLLTEAFRKAMARKGVDYPIHEARLEEAALLVRAYQREPGLTVFITRGRTFSYLCEHTDAALVNVKQSFMSYASIIKEYQMSGIRRIAIMGFSEQFQHNAEKLNNAWDENVNFFAYNWRQYTPEALNELLRKEMLRLSHAGYEAFIGMHAMCGIAKELGLICKENFPDSDMVEAALEDAKQIAQSFLAREERTQTISAFLDIVPEALLKIDEMGLITDHNAAGKRTFPSEALQGDIFQLLPAIRPYIESQRRINQHNIMLSYEKKQLICDIVPIVVGGKYTGAIITARRVDEIQRLEQNIRSKLSEKGLVAKTNFADIYGSGPAIRRAVEWAERIARANGTVLIQGQTGTGKELFAQSIHNASRRAKAPFVAINCAALSPSVLESELFGYVKGAFTGALSEGKKGIFEMAHRGTIFLDEIGELPVDIQAKLLRVIQEKEISRVGDTQVIPVDVRVIAATNRDLEREVEQDRFRSDLFYRLNVLTLQLPTLAERREDIPSLADHFLAQESEPHAFSDDALAFLQECEWPGNIRQLKNSVERASVFVDHHIITRADLEQIFPTRGRTPKPQDGTAPAERAAVERALAEAHGKREKAAAILGVSKATLWRKMKKYNMLGNG